MKSRVRILQIRPEKSTIGASAQNPVGDTDTTRLMDITSEALNKTFNDLRDTAVLLLIRTVLKTIMHKN